MMNLVRLPCSEPIQAGCLVEVDAMGFVRRARTSAATLTVPFNRLGRFVRWLTRRPPWVIRLEWETSPILGVMTETGEVLRQGIARART